MRRFHAGQLLEVVGAVEVLIRGQIRVVILNQSDLPVDRRRLQPCEEFRDVEQDEFASLFPHAAAPSPAL
jgi:hypothetical protein